MIVLLPTFNRTQVLPWVIESILQSDVSGINERILILLVNNFYPGKQAIDEIINPIKFMSPFECVVIHREQKLVAVESWFKAIFEYAHEDEIIVMLGDDDLLLPKTLKRCFETIDACQADMLVTDYFSRLYFSADGSNFVFIGDDLTTMTATHATATDFNFTPEHALPASFVSIHGYKNTESFRKGHEQAITWCRSQHWAPWAFASGLLPTWMSFAVHAQGGKVLKLPEKTVVRGHIISDLLKQEYSDGGSTVFYALLDYQMFTSQALHENRALLEANKRVCLNTIEAKLADLLMTSAVTWKTKNEALRQSDLRWMDLIWNRRFVMGTFFYFLTKIPFVKGWRVRQALKRRSQSTRELMQFLKSLSVAHV